MPKLIAIHEIVATDGNGKRFTVSPGAEFDIPQEDADFLLATGAAKAATKAKADEQPAAEAKVAKKSSKKADADSEDSVI